MAAKTAIQLLNEIGRNLRLSTGTTFTSLTQDLRVGFITQMMNEAKRVVEDRWKWDALKTMYTFSSVIGTSTYTTFSPTTSNERSYLLRTPKGEINFWDTTATRSYRLREATRDYAEHYLTVNGTINAIPSAVAVYQNGTGLTVKFPNPCLDVRPYKFQAYTPQEELEVTTTAVLAPWQPIALYATARCLQERGEEFGGDPDTFMQMYEDAITTALGTTQIGYEDMVMGRA